MARVVFIAWLNLNGNKGDFTFCGRRVRLLQLVVVGMTYKIKIAGIDFVVWGWPGKLY